MAEFYQPVYISDSGTMTGWAGGDPNRFTPEVTVTITDTIFSLWQLRSANFWAYSMSLGTESPHSGGNNEPEFQVRWGDGVWRRVARFNLGDFGRTLGPGTGVPTDLEGVKTQTASFRWANIHDEIGGIFTPRSYTGFTFYLYANTDGLVLPGEGPCRDEEDLLFASPAQLQHSQHPYFVSTVQPTGEFDPSVGYTATGGMVLSDWGMTGPFFNSDLPANTLDYDFDLAEYPLELSGIELRAARVGPIDESLSIEIGLWLAIDSNGDGLLERVDGSPYGGTNVIFTTPPDATARIPLTSLNLVSPTLNGTLNDIPVVPAVGAQVHDPLTLPLTLLQPTVIFRRIRLVDTVSGVFHSAPTANIVLGTQHGGAGLHYRTGDDSFGIVPTYVWVESVPDIFVAPVIRNPYLRLCFDDATPCFSRTAVITSTPTPAPQFPLPPPSPGSFYITTTIFPGFPQILHPSWSDSFGSGLLHADVFAPAGEPWVYWSARLTKFQTGAADHATLGMTQYQPLFQGAPPEVAVNAPPMFLAISSTQTTAVSQRQALDLVNFPVLEVSFGHEGVTGSLPYSCSLTIDFWCAADTVHTHGCSCVQFVG